MTAPDYKMYWDLLETLRWIGTRDEGGVTAMGDIDEKKRTPLTIFPVEAVLDAHALWALVEYDFTDDWEPGARQAGRKSLDANESGMIGPSQALNYLLQLVRSRRIRMTAIKCDRYRVKQVPVPLAKLDDLEFRITSDHRFAKVGLWSRSHNTLMPLAFDGGRLKRPAHPLCRRHLIETTARPFPSHPRNRTRSLRSSTLI